MECLRHQPFVTITKHSQHDWRERIPAPLTYLYDQQSAVQPLEPNYYEQHRVERRRRERHDRSTTHQTSSHYTTNSNHTTEIIWTSAISSYYFPKPDTTRTKLRQTRHTTSIITGSTIHLPIRHTADNTNFPIQNPLQQPIRPPAPSYTNTVHDPWNQPSDDDLPLPPANLEISARPNLEPANLPGREITNSSSDFYTRQFPRLSFRDFTTYITNSERFAPYVEWQMPTRLLEETFNRNRLNHNDPGSNSQMTWWGLLHRQSSLYSDQQTYNEKTLTIPLPTNTADPETAILTTFFYRLMNQERTRAFQLLTEWIGVAGDFYRLSTRQLGPAPHPRHGYGDPRPPGNVSKTYELEHYKVSKSK